MRTDRRVWKLIRHFKEKKELDLLSIRLECNETDWTIDKVVFFFLILKRSNTSEGK